MCGIFGIIQQDSATSGAAPLIDEDKLRDSMQMLAHRGPDAHGVHAGAGFGFAHTRLSLVDLGSRSDQPFCDESGRYVLVYNGEIYNFRELRSELENRGVRFRTTSDTEVLLHCLIHDSPDVVLPRLNGMFAFGLYDTEQETLLLARDRFGMKPLYVCRTAGFFAFASEIKAFAPWLDLEPEPFSISSYLLGFGGPTKGFTMYQNVRGVAPGSYITLRSGHEPQEQSFFSLPDFWNREEMAVLERRSPRRTVDFVEELMVASVDRQLFADSPVGAFCSGGVDSSLLLAMAAKRNDNFAIFHANVMGPWSEYEAARELSRHLKLDLNVVEVREQDFIDYMPDVMRQYEHPHTYHPNCAPFMLVSRLVRKAGVKGMLSGEGSDELFLGYPWLGRKRIIDAYNAQLVRMRGLVRRLPWVGQILWPYAGNGPEVVRTLLNRGEVAADEQRAREAARAFLPTRIDPRQITSIDYLNYHLRALLHRNDCLGMESGIEARFPFLDHDVVRTAINTPIRYKLRFSPKVLEKAHPFIRDKWVIREVANRWIPKNLSQRIKIGFWTTVFQRMQVPPSYFDGSALKAIFGVSSPQLRQVVECADQDLRMRLLHLDVWTRVCLRREPVEDCGRRLRNHITIRPE